MKSAASLGLGFGLLGTSNTAPVSDESAQEIFRCARSLGINRFDTAPLYGGGLSEERLGRLLQGVERDSYVLSTKVGRFRPYAARVSNPKDNHGDSYDYSFDATCRSIEKSLERLGTDRLDIVFIHDCDDHVDEAVSGAWRALKQMKEQGVVGRIGCGSNVSTTHERLLERVPLDTLMVANCYSLLQHSAARRLLPRCMALGTEVELAAPFNSGILATGPDDPLARYDYAVAPATVRERVRQIADVCQQHGVSLKQAALHYCARHPAVHRLILGLAEPAQLMSNQQDLQSLIPYALWDALDDIGVENPLKEPVA
ncbi:aldo/keto reductase [Granulosicoccus sp. 3-233]|uniref:aldo/keto reductase n=1 Tax=Granulosicoccus sp. 3-233 TaxID=3417969 RepID=UPI003D340900